MGENMKKKLQKLTLEEILTKFEGEEFILEVNYVKFFNLTSDMFKIKKWNGSQPAHEIEYRFGNVHFSSLNNVFKVDTNSEKIKFKYSDVSIEFQHLTWSNLEDFED
jgi:hypothetical protein